MQSLDPKAWTVAFVLTGSYLDTGGGIGALLAMIAIFALVNLPAISVLALSGASLSRVLATPRAVQLFNLAMAALLIASILPAIVNVTN